MTFTSKTDDAIEIEAETCPPIVRKSLARVSGVVKADVSAERHEAAIVFDDAVTTVGALIAATTKAGYPSHRIR